MNKHPSHALGTIIPSDEPDRWGNRVSLIQMDTGTYRQAHFATKFPRSLDRFSRIFFGNGKFLPVFERMPKTDNHEYFLEVGDFRVTWGDIDNLSAKYMGQRVDELDMDDKEFETLIAKTLNQLSKVLGGDDDAVILTVVWAAITNDALLFTKDRYEQRKAERQLERTERMLRA